MLKTKCPNCKKIIVCLEDECCPECGMNINVEDVPKEKCPGCKKNLVWTLGYDYTIDDKDSARIDVIDMKDMQITRYFCTCGRQIAVQMETNEGSEVFINSENIDY